MEKYTFLKELDGCRYNNELLVTQSYLTLCDPMDCSLPGSSIHRISQARVLEWCHFLLQRIFPTQGSNPGLPYCRQMLYHLNHQGSPSLHMKLPLQASVFMACRLQRVGSVVVAHRF